jgi:dolichyl-phosphate-mannose--protein O-mannosyl transferase
MRFGWFGLVAVAIVSLAIVRSAIATRLDSFTFDEAYHICSGVSYVRYGDFRLNPEHPPLVKLWVGTIVNVTGFHLGPLRQFTDKSDERHFTE